MQLSGCGWVELLYTENRSYWRERFFLPSVERLRTDIERTGCHLRGLIFSGHAQRFRSESSHRDGGV